MALFSRERVWDAEGVVPDWSRFCQEMSRLRVLQAGQLELTAETLDGIVSMPDELLRDLACHFAWLRRAVQTRHTAQQLPTFPFRDYASPWAATHLSLIASLVAIGGTDTVRKIVSDPDYLTGATITRLAEQTTDDVLAGVAIPSAVAQAAVTRLSTRRHDFEKVLDEQGYRMFSPECGWSDTPPAYVDELWRYDIEHEPLVYAAPPEDEDPASRLTAPKSVFELTSRVPSRLAGARQGLGGTQDMVMRNVWLGFLDSMIELLLEQLAEDLRPRASNRVLDVVEPWTREPWQIIAVHVRPVGGLVRGGRESLPTPSDPVEGDGIAAAEVLPRGGERALDIVLPLPVWRVVPMEDVLDAYARLLAAALLEHVPDVIDHARDVLQRHAAGDADVRARIRTGIDSLLPAVEEFARR